MIATKPIAAAEAAIRPPEPFACEYKQAREVRKFVHARVLTMGRPDLTDDAEMVADELFVNAVAAQLRQGVTAPVVVQCVVQATIVVIDVYDNARARPHLIDPPPPDSAEHGRGLRIVDELTRARWGDRRYGSGKVVTAWLGLTERPGGGPRCPWSPTPIGGQRFTRSAVTRTHKPDAPEMRRLRAVSGE